MPEELKPEDKEALATGRFVSGMTAAVRKHWQVALILLAVFGGDEAKKTAARALGFEPAEKAAVSQPAGPNYGESIVRLETKVENLSESITELRSSLSEFKRDVYRVIRYSDGRSAGPGIEDIENGRVSRLVGLSPTALRQ
jgi:hypothetical protein